MKRPHVTAHFAMTADGKISTRNRTPSGFTSPADKSRLSEVRAGADAVLVGLRTVAADTMSLGLSRADLREDRVRRGLPPVPLRVVVSNSGEINLDLKIFRYHESPLVIFSTHAMPNSRRCALAKRAELYLFQSEVDLGQMLQILRSDFGVRRLVCEGGGSLLRAMAAQDLVDEIRLTVAPRVFGGAEAPTLTGGPASLFATRVAFRIAALSQDAGECVLRLRRLRS